MGSVSPPFHVLIIGAGLGGLSCAISCLQQGLDVTILEKSPTIGEIGAGIQIPPNATRVLNHYGLIDKIEAAGAVPVTQGLLDYKTGERLCTRPDSAWHQKTFGYKHYVIHRADYHKVLLEEATRRGVKIRLDSDVVSLNPVTLKGGQIFPADVVIGADGLRSMVRATLSKRNPTETGDMAFRITVSQSDVLKLNNDFWTRAIEANLSRVWIGPRSHAVIYPVRNKTTWNIVLCCQDNLPADCPTAEADIADMQAAFKGWDPNLQALLTCVTKCLKWKICHMTSLDIWTKDNIALLGDACHPTLPYQAQGAAMAIEDGAVLGILLGSLSKTGRRDKIPNVLRLYQSLRKDRTETNVKGAVDMSHLFQMEDGDEKDQRNKELQAVDFDDPNSSCRWIWADMGYLKNLFNFDSIADAREAYATWEADSI